MQTPSLTPTEETKKKRGRPPGSLNKKTLARLALQSTLPIISAAKTLREDKLRLSDLLEKQTRKITRVVAGRQNTIGARYMREADTVLRNHPRMNPAWKHNIEAFLHRCMAEISYISNWHWAIHALKTFKKVYAPFRYFKMCLLYPHKFQAEEGLPSQVKARVAAWLYNTKGPAASWAYRHKHGLVTKDQAEKLPERRTLRREQRQVTAIRRADTERAIRDHRKNKEEFARRWKVEKKARQLMKAQEPMQELVMPGQGLAFEERVRVSLGLAAELPVDLRTIQQEQDLKSYLRRHPLALGVVDV